MDICQWVYTICCVAGGSRVQGSKVEGLLDCGLENLISHGTTRTDTDDLIDKIYPQITQIAQIIKIS
jgi:hypothetical protein